MSLSNHSLEEVDRRLGGRRLIEEFDHQGPIDVESQHVVPVNLAIGAKPGDAPEDGQSFHGRVGRVTRHSAADQPWTVTLDGYAASHRAVREMKSDGELPADTRLRSSKHLNNLIEQDHRGVKLRIGPMLGFKRFKTAAITIAGIERPLRIRRRQFDLSRLRLRDQRAPAVWDAVLAAQ